MAAGNLTADQARLVDQLTELTGWERGVVATWVGYVSGWGRNRADHNYVGPPGEVYRSTDHAARRAAGLLGPQVGRARALGPAAQIATIGASLLRGSTDGLTDAYRELGSVQAQRLHEMETSPVRRSITARVRSWLS